MKHTWYAFFGLAFLVMAVAGTALAEEPLLRINVPFAFTVQHTKFAAGTYTIEEENPDLLLIRGDSGAAFIMAAPDDSPYASYATKLEFQRYGGTYLLRQVFGNGVSWEIPMSHSAVKLAKNSPAVVVGALSAK